MDKVEFRDWLYRLLTQYGRYIEAVGLAGSRGFGGWQPNSDWDVILCLFENCYQGIDEGRKIEQVIAFDSGLFRPDEADLFFLRPRGVLGRWQWTPEEVSKLDKDSYEYPYALHGDLLGDYERLYRQIRHAPVMYQVGGQWINWPSTDPCSEGQLSSSQARELMMQMIQNALAQK